MNPGALLAWYRANKRDLPWRRTGDPYAIWVSEAMCQQTQVATAAPYYLRWMERFPTVEALAAADEDQALALWSGLGYYRRCRMLLEAARTTAGGLPADAQGWRRLPGVGEYTAAAIASIAHGEAAAAVDGNVERVYARFEGRDEAGPALRALARRWAQANIDPASPGDWNQALMELGALVCTPSGPRCPECPLRDGCRSRAEGRTDRPSRPAKPTVEVEQHVWAIHDRGRFAAAKRGAGEWWAGLWSLPITDRPEPPFPARSATHLARFTHVVTRHRVRATAWLAEGEPPSGFEALAPAELAALGMPAPQRKVLRAAAEALAEPAY